MPLAQWIRRFVFQKLLIPSLILAIFFIMFLTLGPMFFRNAKEIKQEPEMYPSTDSDQYQDQEKVTIERHAKLYADSIRSGALFDAPLALKLIVPTEQREALLRNFKRNIRKREDEPCNTTDCLSTTDSGKDSSTVSIEGSEKAAASTTSESTTEAGTKASRSSVSASGSTPATGSSNRSTKTRGSIGKAATSSVPGRSTTSHSTTKSTSTTGTSSQRRYSASKSKGADNKKDVFAGCRCGDDSYKGKDDEQNNDCDCGKDESKDDSSKGHDDWCNLNHFDT